MRNQHRFTADESLDAVVARRTLVRFPTSLLKVIVTLMENGFPRPTRYPQPVGIVGSRKRDRGYCNYALRTRSETIYSRECSGVYGKFQGERYHCAVHRQKLSRYMMPLHHSVRVDSPQPEVFEFHRHPSALEAITTNQYLKYN